MALLQKKQPSCPVACRILKWIVALLLLATSVAALVGVYQTHIITGSDGTRVVIQFGSTSGSLAILAFVASVYAWGKKMASCMSGSCDVCMK